MDSDVQTTGFKHDSSKVKGYNQHGRACTACLDGLNYMMLRHNEGIWWTTYQCLLDTILKFVRHDSWFRWAPCMRIPPVHSSKYVAHRETLIQYR